ncbi:MAG: chorismate synthase [Clostridiales bacterium]|nr:chorismate synthase [Clostridiales bacterium]
MKHTIFGESHGPAIGVTLSGVPAGIELDMEEIAFELARRAPGKSPLSTARKEADVPEILSGMFEGQTTGTPLCAVIRNTDQRSKDYSKLRYLPRPGHADYTGFLRYDGCNDYRGGGHFSGRLTAPLVFAGAVAKQILAQEGIVIGAHIRSIADVEDLPLENAGEPLSRELLRQVAEKPFPVLDDGRGEAMQQAILQARSERDSVGGIIECAVLGLPPGVGSPDYGENVEGIFAQHLFAVPAVKGVAFGAGFGMASMRGSECNDPIRIARGSIYTLGNVNGGVNGGITNGMPVMFSVAIRPTPSIAQEQDTIDLEKMENARLTIEGRHDPCICHRAVPVIEAAAALATCELLGI